MASHYFFSFFGMSPFQWNVTVSIGVFNDVVFVFIV